MRDKVFYRAEQITANQSRLLMCLDFETEWLVISEGTSVAIADLFSKLTKGKGGI